MGDSVTAPENLLQKLQTGAKWVGIVIGVLVVVFIIYELIGFFNSPAWKAIAKLVGTAFAILSKIASAASGCLSGKIADCAGLIGAFLGILGAALLARLAYATAKNKLLEDSRDAGVESDETSKNIKDAVDESVKEGGTDKEIAERAVRKFAEKQKASLDKASENDPDAQSAVDSAKATVDAAAADAAKDIADEEAADEEGKGEGEGGEGEGGEGDGGGGEVVGE